MNDDFLIKEPVLMGKYEVDHDGDSYRLYYISEKGNRTTKGYFTNPLLAVKKGVELDIIERGGTYTISEYVEEYKKIVEELKNLLEL